MKIFKEVNREIIESIKRGKILVYPTETCYGLGGDATNPEVVEKIYKIKQRREEKPFLVVVPDVAMAMEYLEWCPQLDEIASKYWPGPLTIVGRLKIEDLRLLRLASGVVAPDGTIALRVTAHLVASALARGLGRPLISTSANISGRQPSYSASEVIKMFQNQPDQPDILIDAGELPKNSPTTIVRVVDEEVEILRQGDVCLTIV